MKNQKSLGQISPVILILIGGVIVSMVIIAVFFIIQKPTPTVSEKEIKPKEPVLETNLGDIKIKLIKAEEIGDVLLGSESKNPITTKDVTTTEKFIKVTVSAENIGKIETSYGSWDIGEIVDSEGRKFPYFERLNPWLPAENGCRSSLKPGFNPIFCTKIYEVAKISKDLKVNLTSNKFKVGSIGTESFIDLEL